MRVGEIAWDPHFEMSFLENEEQKDAAETPTKRRPLVPNPFIISKHWDDAIAGMEERIAQQMAMTADTSTARPRTKSKTQLAEKELTTTLISTFTPAVTYDSNDKSLPPPVPVNERVLPDLHVGFGNAQCTHTKQEIVRNRSFAVLLNRLSSNYYFCLAEGKATNDCQEPFVVQMEEHATKLSRPCDLVQALISSGHSVEVCPRSVITTFGVGLCIKESNGNFSNVPLSFFFQSGFEDQFGKPCLSLKPERAIDAICNTTWPSRECVAGTVTTTFFVLGSNLSTIASHFEATTPWLRYELPL
jgi:hypothetical protein